MSTQNTEDIFFFLHHAKTAGSTFKRHVFENLSPDEYIVVDLAEPYLNLHTNTHEYFENQQDIENYFLSLSQAQKVKIKIVLGHDVYYGLHAHFNKSPKYVTFLREPFSREISSYNYFLHHIENAPKEARWNESSYYRAFWKILRDDLFHAGELLSFDEWIRSRTWNNYTARVLIKRGFVHGTIEGDISEVTDHSLSKFYFIGLTESYDTDVAFLYRALGIKKLYVNQNVTKERVAKWSSETKKLFKERNQIDYTIYENAKESRKIFVKEHSFFKKDAFKMRIQKRLHFMHRIPSKFKTCIYSISAWLRGRSRVYSHLVDRIKQTI